MNSPALLGDESCVRGRSSISERSVRAAKKTAPSRWPPPPPPPPWSRQGAPFDYVLRTLSPPLFVAPPPTEGRPKTDLLATRHRHKHSPYLLGRVAPVTAALGERGEAGTEPGPSTPPASMTARPRGRCGRQHATARPPSTSSQPTRRLADGSCSSATILAVSDPSRPARVPVQRPRHECTRFLAVRETWKPHLHRNLPDPEPPPHAPSPTKRDPAPTARPPRRGRRR